MKKIIALLLVLASVFAFAACDLIKQPCTNHVDADNDGKCDTCQANMPTTPPACTTHVDSNNDGKCDTCQADMPATPPACTTHTDVNPKDNKCDTCGATVESKPEGLDLTPITDAIAATTYTTATVTTAIDSEYGTLTGEYTVTFSENGTATVDYSYEQFTTVSEENADKPMKTTVEGSATIDAQGNVTSGSVGSQITSVSACAKRSR